jgi:tRNA-dihydrouridine synthase
MFSDNLVIRGTVFSPPVFCAPMAGITHSAFRRLVSDFGGYGALFTEMLSGLAVLSENLSVSPYTKKRVCEGKVIYQLLLNGTEDIAGIVDRLEKLAPAAIDLNLGCPAPEIRKLSAGGMLFDDHTRLVTVLKELRKAWHGPLTVKCRLGIEREGWDAELIRRLKLFEDCGVDAVTVHPRFFHEKLKRTSRWKLLPWIISRTSVPVIANGDIVSRSGLENHADYFDGCAGIMAGRIAGAKPWIFRELAGETVPVDYLEVWERFYRYTLEDFPAQKALGRIKEFTAYFSRNFFFGHSLFTAVQRVQSIDAAYNEAARFLSANPKTVGEVSVAGI